MDPVWAAAIDPGRIDPEVQSTRGEGHTGRAVAAWPTRRLTAATLRELSGRLCLRRPQSISNPTRQFERQVAKNQKLREEVGSIESRMLRKTNNKV